VQETAAAPNDACFKKDRRVRQGRASEGNVFAVDGMFNLIITISFQT